MATAAAAPPAAPQPSSSSPSTSSIFTIPRPLRSLFNHFPLQIYPPNALPSTSASATEVATTSPTLYIFTASSSSNSSSPSPNPTCLKLQTYLRAANIPHACVSSTNHASPSGALPFLHLGSSSAAESGNSSGSSRIPLTGGKIIQYAKQNANPPNSLSDVESHPKIEAYRSLIAQAIRPAWLHDLYLLESNTPLLKAIYLPPSSLTHPSLLHSLRSAATAEILQTTRRSLIEPALLYADAISALRALDALLASTSSSKGLETQSRDNGLWFFGAESPSLFDAEVFAYSWLLLDLDGPMKGLESGLRKDLAEMSHLARHRTRLYERCWGDIHA